MRFVKMQCVSPVPAIALGLSLMLLVAMAEAQRGDGKGGRGGGGRRGSAMGQKVQQKPGKPADGRFLRVCGALSLEEGQLEGARVVYDSMELKKSGVLEERQRGAISSPAAKQALSELSRRFEEKFMALLKEEQRKQLWELKQDGTLEDQWW